MISEHDKVALVAPLAAEGLETGDVGAVVRVHSRQEAYEVEFVTFAGQTAAVVTVTAKQVRPVNGSDIPHARTRVRHSPAELYGAMAGMATIHGDLDAAVKETWEVDRPAESMN